MRTQDPIASRREVLKQMFKGAAYVTFGGLALRGVLTNSDIAPIYLRPPAAKNENLFVEDCTQCSFCVDACPYDALKLATDNDNLAEGTPYFEARTTPCYMCEDMPCVEICPTEALDIKNLNSEDTTTAGIHSAKMGIAIVCKENCLAYEGVQCDTCYRACPIKGKAISLSSYFDSNTEQYFSVPEINQEACTGCGLCEYSCIMENPSIKIFDFSTAPRVTSKHFAINSEKNKRTINIHQDGTSSLDYLNGMEDIFDDD